MYLAMGFSSSSESESSTTMRAWFTGGLAGGGLGVNFAGAGADTGVDLGFDAGMDGREHESAEGGTATGGSVGIEAAGCIEAVGENVDRKTLRSEEIRHRQRDLPHTHTQTHTERERERDNNSKG
jgi:hypothetical protein